MLTEVLLDNSPSGFMQVADLPSLPGSNVSKGDLPDCPKPLSGDAGNKVCGTQFFLLTVFCWTLGFALAFSISHCNKFGGHMGIQDF